MVPSEVKSDQYCQNLMDLLCKIAKYMCSVGPKKMSKKKLIQVLSTLSPWELQVPCVAAAIEVSMLLLLFFVVIIWLFVVYYPASSLHY